MAPSRKRPLVNSEPLDEFGAAKAEAASTGPQGADLLYTPGWSDLRYQRDLQMAEYAQGTRRGKDVSSLPVNVRIVAANSATGTPQGIRMMKARNGGYRPITMQDVGQAWFTEKPPGAREMPDGSLITAAGDGVYMVAPAEKVAVTRARNQRAMQDATVRLGQDTEGLVGKAAAYPGADPTISVS